MYLARGLQPHASSAPRVLDSPGQDAILAVKARLPEGLWPVSDRATVASDVGGHGLETGPSGKREVVYLQTLRRYAMDTIGLPTRPAHLSVYAEACLQALARQGWGE